MTARSMGDLTQTFALLATTHVDPVILEAYKRVTLAQYEAAIARVQS